MPPQLTSADLAQLRRLGRDPADIERQLELFRNPPLPIRLQRPCRVGDGITRLSPDRTDLIDRWRRAAAAGRLVKFVPASGAATRMFGFLPEVLGAGSIDLTDLERRAAGGDEPSRQTLALLEDLRRMPFVEELEATVRNATGEGSEALRRRDPGRLLELMASDGGLGLAALPKGLLPFHRYHDGTRTAFEEHVWEAGYYLAGSEGATMRQHYTISAEHEELFAPAARALESASAARTASQVTIGFSRQDPATDTLAVDLENRPARGPEGRLLFRPGGHGALISNLARLADEGADIVFVKNIDNVTRARDHGQIGLWKRLLAGYLLELQETIDRLLERLAQPDDRSAAVDEAAAFVTGRLTRSLPPSYAEATIDGRADSLVARLERPLRVCGVVRNRGEPGGGPFWVEQVDGSIDGQIVEGSQVDSADELQRAVWASSTHFNPVDLVCGVRDRHGCAFELARFVDDSTVFIARKTHAGSEIKALERPGLWNGAMAGWNTAFVEVPEETFAPVKTLLDLLRPAHQPRSGAGE